MNRTYAPYSFSKLNTFRYCPKQFEYAYIKKVEIDKDYTDPFHFIKGRFIHAYIANRLSGGNGEIRGYADIESEKKLEYVELIESVLQNEAIQETFDFQYNLIEQKILLDTDLEITDKNHTWIGYIDYAAVQDDYALIIDWKSGRFKDNPHFDQLELYAIWLESLFPNLEKIDLMFYYVETDQVSIKTLDKKDIIKTKQDISNRIYEIENTQEFVLKKSNNCVRCPYYERCLVDQNF